MKRTQIAFVVGTCFRDRFTRGEGIEEAPLGDMVGLGLSGFDGRDPGVWFAIDFSTVAVSKVTDLTTCSLMQLARY